MRVSHFRAHHKEVRHRSDKKINERALARAFHKLAHFLAKSTNKMQTYTTNEWPGELLIPDFTQKQGI